MIDQGSDDSVNAVNIKKLVVDTTDVEVTDATKDATLIQSRHRIPEHPLDDGQILVLQVPTPEPLRSFEPSEAATKRLHAEADYTGAWLELFRTRSRLLRCHHHRPPTTPCRCSAAT